MPGWGLGLTAEAATRAKRPALPVAAHAGL